MKTSNKVSIFLFILVIFVSKEQFGIGQELLNRRRYGVELYNDGAICASAYVLYADYLKDPESFKDLELTAFLLTNIEACNLAEPLLRKIECTRDVDSLCDSLRFYYYYSLAVVEHEKNNNIKALKSISLIQRAPALELIKADCYVELGLFDDAVKVYSSLFDNFDAAYLNCLIGESLRKDGQYLESIKYYELAKEENPNWAIPYYGIGWSYELSGNETMALQYYNNGLNIDRSCAYLFLLRGELYNKNGHKELAEKDFQTVLRLDKTITNGTCRQYALFFLGRNDDALNWMNRVVETQPNDPGCYYDKACLCCRMGLYSEAIKAIECAFTLGFRCFAHLNADDDIESIRNMPEYIVLYNKYYEIYQKEQKQLKDML